MRRLAGATTSGVLRIRRREELYRELLTRFFVVLECIQGPDTAEAERRRALDDFYDRLADILDHEGTLFLSEREGHLFVNAIRTRIDADAFAMQRFLVREFVQNRIAGLIFERGILREEIPLCIDVLFKRGGDGGDHVAKLRAASVQKVHVLERAFEEAAPPSTTLSDTVARAADLERTYFKHILVLRHFLRGLDATCPVAADERHRIVKSMAQRLLVHDGGHVALDLVREFETTALASVLRVTVPAVSVALRYGLSADLATEFGVAALLAGVLRAVDDAAQTDPFERQQGLHLVANGGASGLLLLSALCGWDDKSKDDSGKDDNGKSEVDPSVVTSILRATRKWFSMQSRGIACDVRLAKLEDMGFAPDVLRALDDAFSPCIAVST